MFYLSLFLKFVRGNNWLNLNGEWDFFFDEKNISQALLFPIFSDMCIPKLPIVTLS